MTVFTFSLFFSFPFSLPIGLATLSYATAVLTFFSVANGSRGYATPVSAPLLI